MFLDCVTQLIYMNRHMFEFTPHYLANLAFNCFTSKYFELTFPILQNTDQIVNQ